MSTGINLHVLYLGIVVMGALLIASSVFFIFAHSKKRSPHVPNNISTDNPLQNFINSSKTQNY